MNDALKNWGIGVATAVAVSALGLAGNTYVDVQVLKYDQVSLREISEQQKQMTNQIKDILASMDKQMAVQDKTLAVLSETVNELKVVKGKK
ncbi:MAG: hypothetical protein ACRDCE_14605 [Cetobacterium sp.]|uniref:hypothetical protein n=1 Tax=Cetobacterium sp. TaxID=2071632 RepID=UPI003EE7C475